MLKQLNSSAIVHDLQHAYGSGQHHLFLLYSGQNYVFLCSVAHLVMQSDTSSSLLATTFYQIIHKVRCILKTATILSLLGLRAVLKWQQSNQLKVSCALQLVLSILCLCSVLFHQDFFIFLLYNHISPPFSFTTSNKLVISSLPHASVLAVYYPDHCRRYFLPHSTLSFHFHVFHTLLEIHGNHERQGQFHMHHTALWSSKIVSLY